MQNFTILLFTIILQENCNFLLENKSYVNSILKIIFHSPSPSLLSEQGHADVLSLFDHCRLSVPVVSKEENVYHKLL